MATTDPPLVPAIRIRRPPVWNGRRRPARPRRGRRPSTAQGGLAALVTAALLATGCVNNVQHSSGRVFPLPRQQPGDGLAVVNAPGGRGIHIWLDPNSETPGLCLPRWNPDPSRLVGGDGPQPRSAS